jgi:hypothetical protein
MDKVAQVKYTIGDHISEDWFWVTNIIGCDMIVGQPWLELHDPDTKWSERTLTFLSAHCTQHCLLHNLPVGLSCRSDGRSTAETLVPTPRGDIAVIDAAWALAMGRRDESSLCWIMPEHWDALEEINDAEHAFVNAFAADCAAVTSDDFKKFHDKLNREPMSRRELLKRVPKAYHDLIDLWDPKEAVGVPPEPRHRP